MNKIKEIRHYKTDLITCPYCGHEDDESHTYSYDIFEMRCDKCQQKFSLQTETETTYTTSKIESD